MVIDTANILSVSEINRNFSKAIRKVDEAGHVIIFKNNKPRYQLSDIERHPLFELSDDEKIDVVAARILGRHKAAFMELAK